MGRGGALVESMTFNRMVVGSTPVLAATLGPWAIDAEIYPTYTHGNICVSSCLKLCETINNVERKHFASAGRSSRVIQGRHSSDFGQGSRGGLQVVVDGS